MAYPQIPHALSQLRLLCVGRGRARMRIIPRFIAFAHDSSISYLDIAKEPVIDENSEESAGKYLNFPYYAGGERRIAHHIE